MTRKLFIADLHYGHANAIAFDARPFTSVEEMNTALVENWNNAVNPGDEVYILGDMFWGGVTKAIPVLDSLNGDKILIKGNHDHVGNADFAKRFADIVDYAELTHGDLNIVLSHYPIPCFRGHFRGWVHFYGHVHTSFEFNMMENARNQMEALYEKPCRMYNVGAMLPYMGYTPRTAAEIIEGGERYRKLTREISESLM